MRGEQGERERGCRLDAPDKLGFLVLDGVAVVEAARALTDLAERGRNLVEALELAAEALWRDLAGGRRAAEERARGERAAARQGGGPGARVLGRLLGDGEGERAAARGGGRARARRGHGRRLGERGAGERGAARGRERHGARGGEGPRAREVAARVACEARAAWGRWWWWSWGRGSSSRRRRAKGDARERDDGDGAERASAVRLGEGEAQ